MEMPMRNAFGGKPMSTIESQDLKLVDLFKDFYAVPNYQREYVWTEEEVEQLLQDVRSEHLDEVNSESLLVLSWSAQEQRDGLI
jgi:Protein of unknown function DUF262